MALPNTVDRATLACTGRWATSGRVELVTSMSKNSLLFRTTCWVSPPNSASRAFRMRWEGEGKSGRDARSCSHIRAVSDPQNQNPWTTVTFSILKIRTRELVFRFLFGSFRGSFVQKTRLLGPPTVKIGKRPDFWILRIRIRYSSISHERAEKSAPISMIRVRESNTECSAKYLYLILWLPRDQGKIVTISNKFTNK